MKKGIKLVAGAVIASGILFAGLPVHADVTCPDGTAQSGNTKKTLAECNIEDDTSLMPTVVNLIKVAMSVLGLVAVVVIILGGIQFMTAGGDPGKVKKAKDTILYGVIGLVVAVLAYAIVNFIIASVNGAKS